GEPTAGGGARDPKIRGDGYVPGPLDEIPKPVIVAPLTASRAGHADDHRPFAHAAQVLDDSAGPSGRVSGPLRDENSRPKVQNVPGDRPGVHGAQDPQLASSRRQTCA